MAAPKLIVADRLSKVYRVYGSPWQRLLEPLVRRRYHRAFAALDDVSFALRRGESLGIIGENGAGKSTLLKLVSGVTAPSSGTIAVRGKVASLLELGMGFHPEFSGRQNIRLNAAMMGVAEDELERKLPEILAFSELGEFIDRPVKTYSTGMAMRLGFAIAVQVDPEILVIDEALSVGDGYFQKKCMDRLLAMERSGVTLLFCSHAMYYVSTFCQRALWLRHGRVAALGPADEVIREYENFLLAKSQAVAEAREETPAAAPARILDVGLLAGDGARTETPVYRHREPWTVEVVWRATEPGLAFHVGVGIDRIDGVQIASFGTHADGLDPLSGETDYTVRLTVPELPMIKGEYALYVFLLDEEGLHVYDRHVVQSAFTVAAADFRIGLIEVEHRWELPVAAPPGAPQPVAPQPKTAAPGAPPLLRRVGASTPSAGEPPRLTFGRREP